MAVTLNLKHTFTTRVVYSSADIAELREDLKAGLSAGEVVKGKEQLLITAIQASDEELVLMLTKAGLKENLRGELNSLFGDLNITRMGPVQTALLTTELKPSVRKRKTADAALKWWLAGGSQRWIMLSGLEDFERVLFTAGVGVSRG